MEREDPGLLSLPGMVNWFSPRNLTNAAVRAIVSPVFGIYADARSNQASVDGFGAEALKLATERHFITDEDIVGEDGAVWIDYIADTGDGFDSSYAIASLVAADHLEVARTGSKNKVVLPSGRMLVLGGDQVYPYPSRKEYESRFVYPYRMAFSSPARPRLTFVIPGNHDWYDGLNSFDFLFCQARFGSTRISDPIGNLQFTQHRSYFAVRLPNNWWIWGADIQFSEYLDVGQVRYFQAVAEQMLERRPEEPEHKIILCIAEPGWQYEHEAAVRANSNIQALTQIAESGAAKVCTVLSGDTHHYCRYFSKDLNLNLITAGGGGSYLHPTHQLYETITFDWLGEPTTFTQRCKPTPEGRPAEGVAAFPSKPMSRWMTFGNLFFPIFNYGFATFLGTVYWLMTWMYAQTPIPRKDCKVPDGANLVLDAKPLVETVLNSPSELCGLRGDGFSQRLQDLIGISITAGIQNFLLGIFVIALFSVCIYYADARRTWVKMFMGTLHALSHIFAMVALYLVVSKFGTLLGGWIVGIAKPHIGEIANLLQTATYIVLMIFGGGTVAGLVWGLYLLISCAVFKRHWNDAFSSLRLTDYKNFLRLKIEGEVLTIYPIGLRRVPSRLEWQRENGRPDGRLVPRFGMSPHLVDGPIVIDAREVRMRKSSTRSAPALT